MRKWTLIEGLALLSVVGWGVCAITLRRASSRIRFVEEAEPAADSGLPSLSVIVPACNEAETVEPAMSSLLAVDYPGIEIVALNDRSTDATSEILHRLAARDERLRVIDITTLPAGWLGKNHALRTGARQSHGDYILFTDADVHFQPDALRRAIAVIQASKADHLAIAPHIVLCGFWERLLISYFGVGFALHYRPWESSDPEKDGFAGIGAFNLVRREAYESVGGHAALPMEVADDVKLGKTLKKAGKRLEYRFSREAVSVRWMVGFRGFVNGLTKNFFAGIEFHWGHLVGFSVLIALSHTLPLPGILWGTPRSRWLFAGAMAAMVACAAPPAAFVPAEAPSHPGAAGQPPSTIDRLPAALFGLAYPIASVVWLFTMWRSAVLTETRGGIEWRGTFYPIDQLRRGVV